jgi:hypothetical protein
MRSIASDTSSILFRLLSVVTSVDDEEVEADEVDEYRWWYTGSAISKGWQKPCSRNLEYARSTTFSE